MMTSKILQLLGCFANFCKLLPIVLLFSRRNRNLNKKENRKCVWVIVHSSLYDIFFHKNIRLKNAQNLRTC